MVCRMNRSACVAGAFVLATSAIVLWTTSAGANSAMAVAGAEATRGANKCGSQFTGAKLQNCIAGVTNKLANRIQGEGNAGASLASQVRSAAATIGQGNKQSSVAALSQVRSSINGYISRFMNKGKADTPGMNAMGSAISTMIRVIQAKG